MVGTETFSHAVSCGVYFLTFGFLYTSQSTFSFLISAVCRQNCTFFYSHLVHFGYCHYVIKYLMRDMMHYHCLRVFRSRVRRIWKQWLLQFFCVPIQSAWLFRCSGAVPCSDPEHLSWRSFLFTVNLSHARQVTYEVWGFHVRDRDVCSDWMAVTPMNVTPFWVTNIIKVNNTGSYLGKLAKEVSLVTVCKCESSVHGRLFCRHLHWGTWTLLLGN